MTAYRDKVSCILRVCGLFDPTAFLSRASFTAHDHWHAGSRRKSFSPHVQPLSGLLARVSCADFDEPDVQISEAISFLQAHTDSLSILQQLLTEGDPTWADSWMELDFGIEDRVGTLDSAGKEIVHQADHLPASLARLAGNLGIGLTISRYPRTEE
ncbi:MULTISPECIES: hypothetical protein [Deinococcus]|uniref:Uncharacterized protein n=1 Tax=Deinococcus rufus TaxID=2136097 RepID=A0ABV7ZA56_9DEIO|nr:hypothetical protein [Deinococcus sp. AB2017081]WQE95001.1 hypothetical protein U2P90_16660 [Deinococcus sp. AB2017081]